MLKFDDTICAPATIAGTGALCVIRVSGPDTLAIADKVVRFKSGDAASARGYSLKYGEVLDADGSVLDDVLVSIFKAPHSYTGEDSVEISCHASSYIAGQIVYKLIECGAHAAEPGEFTRRAFVNGKMDLSQAEAVADVIAAGSGAAHRIAMTQMRGGVSEEIALMRSQLLDMTSLMELELDFSEEDVEFADRKQLRALLDAVMARCKTLTGSFRLGNAIKNGIPVAIVGAANTGKSTLLNALLCEDRAIVSPVAGTTRDSIEETFNLDGILFRFIDTAGLRQTDDLVESIGISRTLSKLSQAQIVIGVLDLTLPEDEFEACFDDLLSRVDLSSQKLVVALNKVDLCGDISGDSGGLSGDSGTNKNVTNINKFVSRADCEYDTVIISAKDGSGLEELKNKLVKLCRSDILGAAGTVGAAVSGRAAADAAGAGCLSTGTDVSGRASADAAVAGSFSSGTAVSRLAAADAAGAGSFSSGTDVSGRASADAADAGSFSSGTAVSRLAAADVSGAAGAVLISNARHYNALCSALEALSLVRAGLDSGTPSDLAAQDLRDALYHLGTITGEITTDEVLGNIFKKFCIGK